MHVEKKKKKLDIQQLPKLAILNKQLQNLLTFCLQLGVGEWIFVLKSLQWLASVTSLCAQCTISRQNHVIVTLLKSISAKLFKTKIHSLTPKFKKGSQQML